MLGNAPHVSAGLGPEVLSLSGLDKDPNQARRPASRAGCGSACRPRLQGRCLTQAWPNTPHPDVLPARLPLTPFLLANLGMPVLIHQHIGRLESAVHNGRRVTVQVEEAPCGIHSHVQSQLPGQQRGCLGAHGCPAQHVPQRPIGAVLCVVRGEGGSGEC